MGPAGQRLAASLLLALLPPLLVSSAPATRSSSLPKENLCGPGGASYCENPPDYPHAAILRALNQSVLAQTLGLWDSAGQEERKARIKMEWGEDNASISHNGIELN